jgi:hypothetical protein
LKEDYKQLNLYYDPALNDYFSCDLKVLGDDDKSFTIDSGVTGLTDY